MFIDFIGEYNDGNELFARRVLNFSDSSIYTAALQDIYNYFLYNVREKTDTLHIIEIRIIKNPYYIE